MACMNVQKQAGPQIVTVEAGVQGARAALWHSSCNSCSAHPSTTTHTHHHYYYHHYQEPGWRNRCLALLPAGTSRDTRSLVRLRYHLPHPAPGRENPNIIRSLCHPFQNILQHQNTMECNLQMLLVSAGFINRQQSPVEILISSCLSCAEV